MSQSVAKSRYLKCTASGDKGLCFAVIAVSGICAVLLIAWTEGGASILATSGIEQGEAALAGRQYSLTASVAIGIDACLALGEVGIRSLNAILFQLPKRFDCTGLRVLCRL